MASRLYMRTHPDFQIRNTESPMPKITIGRYASLARPSLDSLRMKPSEDGGSGGAVEKRLSSLMWLSARSAGQTEFLGWRRWLALGRISSLTSRSQRLRIYREAQAMHSWRVWVLAHAELGTAVFHWLRSLGFPWNGANETPHHPTRRAQEPRQIGRAHV